MAKQKRLFRSKKDRIVSGVCGGIAEFFNIDATWVRLGFALLTLLDGIGIILYLIAWALVPLSPEKGEKEAKSIDGAMIFGAILILIGASVLLKRLFVWLNMGIVFAVVVIVVGIFILVVKPK